MCVLGLRLRVEKTNFVYSSCNTVFFCESSYYTKLVTRRHGSSFGSRVGVENNLGHGGLSPGC